MKYNTHVIAYKYYDKFESVLTQINKLINQ